MSEHHSRLRVTVQNRHLYFDNIDWPKVKAGVIENMYSAETGSLGRWPVGGGMGAVEVLLNTVLEMYVTVGKELVKIHSNKDLTDEAKTRMQKEAFDKYVERVEPLLQKAGDKMKTIASRAESGLLAVLPRDKNDMNGTLLDQEIRAHLRSLTDSDRNKLIAKASAGEYPEFVQAILRAPAPLSGVSPIDAKSLNAAGIVATHGEALELLREYAVTFQSVMRTTMAALDNFSHLAPAAGFQFKQPAITWKREAEGAGKLMEWLSSMPIPHGE